MKIVSYNINGIRAANRLGLIDWIEKSDYDIFCFQEIRANEDITRSIFSDSEQISLLDGNVSENFGVLEKYFKFYNCGSIPGYAGTMVLTKIKPDKVEYGLKDFWFDQEGRVITVYFGGLAIVNAYIPNGNSRLEFKMQFLDALTKYLEILKNKYSVICVGDFNIANDEIDLTNPKECKNKSVFLPIEREAFKKILALGYVDTFRYLYPDKREYSWRSYRSRQTNLPSTNYNSWKYRIDYAILYNRHALKLLDCEMPDLIYSDHLPVICSIEN